MTPHRPSSSVLRQNRSSVIGHPSRRYFHRRTVPNHPRAGSAEDGLAARAYGDHDYQRHVCEPAEEGHQPHYYDETGATRKGAEARDARLHAADTLAHEQRQPAAAYRAYS